MFSERSVPMTQQPGKASPDNKDCFVYNEAYRLPDTVNAAKEYRDRVKRVSLTHLRIQQFLHLDDRHIPLPIIRLYYNELENEANERNKEALMVCMMLLRDWHVKRNQLNFIRDLAKVALMFGKRFTDSLVIVETALNNLPVTQQDVYESIMRDIYSEADRKNMSLGEFLLNKYNDCQSIDRSGDSIKSLEMLFPNANIRQNTFLTSFTARYLLRVLKESMRSAVRLDYGQSGGNGAAAAAGFFEESVPSWSQTNNGLGCIRSTREIAEDAEIRRKLVEKLMNNGGGGGGGSGGERTPNNDDDCRATTRSTTATTANENLLHRSSTMATKADSRKRVRTTFVDESAITLSRRNNEDDLGDETRTEVTDNETVITIDTNMFRQCYDDHVRRTQKSLEIDASIKAISPLREPAEQRHEDEKQPQAPVIETIRTEEKLLEENANKIAKTLSALSSKGREKPTTHVHMDVNEMVDKETNIEGDVIEDESDDDNGSNTMNEIAKRKRRSSSSSSNRRLNKRTTEPYYDDTEDNKTVTDYSVDEMDDNPDDAGDDGDNGDCGSGDDGDDGDDCASDNNDGDDIDDVDDDDDDDHVDEYDNSENGSADFTVDSDNGRNYRYPK